LTLKIIRQILIILLIGIALLQSCSTQIHYVQVFRTEPLNLSKVKDFYVFENDTVRIVYYFWNEDGIMAFNIYNKSDKPIYVDWKKSTFITNSSKSNYWSDKTTIKGAWGNSSSAYSDVFATLSNSSKMISERQTKVDKSGIIDTKSQSNTTNIASLEGTGTSYINTQGWSHMTVSKQERITFIPPRSFINNSIAYKIQTDSYHEWESGYTQTKEALSSDPKKTTTISSKTFTKTNTPLDFRNFLTLSFKEDFSSEFYIDNEFYIKEILAVDKRHFFLYKTDKSNNTVSIEILPKYINGVDFYVKGN